jgi:hypothetical protein
MLGEIELEEFCRTLMVANSKTGKPARSGVIFCSRKLLKEPELQAMRSVLLLPGELGRRPYA